jgi:hypothetical protein
MIALDTVVLFALTARWSVARGDLLDGENPAAADVMPGDPLYGNLSREATPYERRIT